MSERYLLSIDQGTSATKAVIFTSKGEFVTKASAVLKSSFPQVGFVEQNPLDIYQSVLEAVKSCLHYFTKDFSGKPEQIAACGISNQRETFVLWDRAGTPLANAIVWQCKRSVGVCDRLRASGIEPEIQARTGLIIDPYFSGTKLIWLYENDSSIREAINSGNAYFGTVDAWLLFKLTGGQRYCTDYTNACRTLFFNINDLTWDSYLLREFNLNSLNLPEPKPSSSFFGESDFNGIFPKPVRISAMIGDSHAAAFGEGCFAPGSAKATLGTGSSILMNTGSQKIDSRTGMVTTICWSTADRVDYALEGIIVTCGATITWLRDQLGLFAQSRDTEAMARAVQDAHGVQVIPAFSGLGAPHWKMSAKAAILGLTFGCDRNHIVRAALESIPFQIHDVISAMETDSGLRLQELNVDGGITANQFVMQCLTDVLNTKVVNLGFEDVTALGAAYLAGLECGVFAGIEYLQQLNTEKKVYTPGQNREQVFQTYQAWEKTIKELF